MYSTMVAHGMAAPSALMVATGEKLGVKPLGAVLLMATMGATSSSLQRRKR
jgi:hypothetical protein